MAFLYIISFLVALFGVIFLILKLKARYSYLNNPPPCDVYNKHVLITGGSSGIGKAIAINLVCRPRSKAPKVITLVGRNLEKLCLVKNKLVALIYEYQTDLHNQDETLIRIMSCDVSDEERVFSAFSLLTSFKAKLLRQQRILGRTLENSSIKYKVPEETVECDDVIQLIPIDILICSAGITNPRNHYELNIADYDDLMKVNFLGTVNCVRAVLPNMLGREFFTEVVGPGKQPLMEKNIITDKNRGGRIILISSQVGQTGMFGYSAYAPTKFAVRGYAESLYQEVKPHNVHIAVSFPPDTETPMYDEEMKTKPIECKKMSESGSVFKAQDIAKDIVNSIENNWSFNITHGFDGYMLGVLGGTLSQPRNFSSHLLELVTLPLFRLIWIWAVLSGWFKIAEDFKQPEMLHKRL